MKKLIKRKVVIAAMIVVAIMGCSKDDCSYQSLCVEQLNVFYDFEKDTIGTLGDWHGIFIDPVSSVQLVGGSNVLHTKDISGESWVYNTNFPTNLVGSACELHYDVAYSDGGANTILSDNSIAIYQGASPASYTFQARFVLNPKLVSVAPATTIIVPLSIVTSGTTLPSNIYGHWEFYPPIATPAATDINKFNAALQNVSGIGLLLDETGTPNPTEEWWFDNFYLKTCCP